MTSSLFILLFLVGNGYTAVINNSSQRTSTLEYKEYKWAGCENLGKCKMNGYSKPPLMILSFDGFAKEYLERRIVKSLELIGECGVKADKVYPSFPSKTFPNYYTMITGLYPESHGITDNSVFDPKLSPELVAMRKSEAGKFYDGEPIWSAYKRLTGRPAHCLFWVGCYFNNTGYMPDVSPDYNQTLPLQERIDTLIGWLKLPDDERPGLITAYLHQPDEAGHHQKSKEDVNEALVEVDDYLNVLMQTLFEEDLLECINLVIVSDHGMQVLEKEINLEEYFDMNGLILSKGVVARLHLNGTERTVDEVADELRCKIDGIKVNTIKDLPLRKHYSKSSRVGDIVIEGKAGTYFYKSDAGGDHGYDYYNENMNTIMFARGPSFRQNVTVPPYQNIQYMNLWLSLLGLEGAIENNGTIGFFDSILKNSPVRENNWNSIEECVTYGSADALQCEKMQTEDWKKLSNHLETCSSLKNLPIYSSELCFQNYCENTLIVSKDNDDYKMMVLEVLTEQSIHKKPTDLQQKFSFVNTKYTDKCPPTENNQIFYTAGSEAVSKIAVAQYEFPISFMKNILIPLSIKTDEYLKRFGKLFVISGLASDENLDGISDEKASINFTHFYRILVTCNGNWLSTNPPLCRKINEMRILAFVFPILNRRSTMDCMSPDGILLDYTATVEDVEKIAGFEFQIGALSYQQNVYLRRNITTTLW